MSVLRSGGVVLRLAFRLPCPFVGLFHLRNRGVLIGKISPFSVGNSVDHKKMEGIMAMIKVASFAARPGELALTCSLQSPDMMISCRALEVSELVVTIAGSQSCFP